MSARTWCVLFALLAALSAGCGSAGSGSPATPPAAPAKVQNGGVKEADLATITLTPQAEQRLAIETAPATVGRVARRRTFSGEAFLPPGKSLTVGSPVAGTLLAGNGLPAPGAGVTKGQVFFRVLPLVAAQRDLRVTADTELAAAKARLEAARQRQARAEQMLQDQVGSLRAQEEARNETTQAQVAFDGARARLERIEQSPLDADASLAVAVPASGTLLQLLAAPGQKVAAGSPLFSVADYSRLWLRVPVFAGDLGELDPGAPAQAGKIGERPGPFRPAPPVGAPPTADAMSDTVDRYYELPGGFFHPGEKLYASLLLRGDEVALQVPRAAILYDFRGGAWVYEEVAPHVFARRRVDLRRIQGEIAILERGLKPGAKVVTVGAAELFGTEFGAGK